MWWLSSRRPGYSYYQNIVFVSEFGIFFILCSLQSFMAIVAKEIPAKFWFLKTAYMHHNNYSENKFFSKDCHLVLGYCCQKSLALAVMGNPLRVARCDCGCVWERMFLFNDALDKIGALDFPHLGLTTPPRLMYATRTCVCACVFIHVCIVKHMWLVTKKHVNQKWTKRINFFFSLLCCPLKPEIWAL